MVLGTGLGADFGGDLEFQGSLVALTKEIGFLDLGAFFLLRV